MAGKPKPDILS